MVTYMVKSMLNCYNDGLDYFTVECKEMDHSNGFKTVLLYAGVLV